MDNNKEKKKRNDFKDKLKSAAAVGVAGSVIAGITLVAMNGKKELESIDMSNYNLDNSKYREYSDGKDSTEDRLVLLEESVRIYKELASDSNLTDAQKEALSKEKSRIKSEMSSDLIADLYLSIFKEKMKSAYHVDNVSVDYKSGSNVDKNFSVKLNGNTFMDEQDKTKEIKSAVWDIVDLQYMSEKVSYDDEEIKNFIKMYDNMKGFSNLEFVKEKYKPLEFKETYEISLKDDEYEVYSMDSDAEER